MKIILSVGARPNFIKMAPLYFELIKKKNIESVIVHTGQHYDYRMSQAFFENLDLPNPHYFLGVKTGTHIEQTAKIMIEFEKVLLKENPDLVITFGDVNSTLACSVVPKKLFIPLAHVEAGLRSFDISMPEETNRKLTDSMADFLFTPSVDANENLAKEGIKDSKVHFVGNIMIDSLVEAISRLDKCHEDQTLKKFNLQKKRYALVTFHRPSNVDNKDTLEVILKFLNYLSRETPIIFPMHPRTRKNICEFGIDIKFGTNFNIIEPMKYKEFILLEKNASFVLTDSGGIQEETTYLNTPCLTVRSNTERPITIMDGTNELVHIGNISEKIDQILSGKWKQGKIPELWDGKTAERIVSRITNFRN